MATISSIKSQVQALIDECEYMTNCGATDLTTQVDALAGKYKEEQEKNASSEWKRPGGWQDLDAIDMSDFEGVYATYEVGSDRENFISMNGGALTIDEVAVASDGTVTVVQSIETTTADDITRANINGLTNGYHTFRITGFSANFCFKSSYSINGGTVDSQVQYCKEFYARFPTLGMALEQYPWTTRHTEHIKFIDAALVTDPDRYMDGGVCFINGAQLCKVEFDNFTLAGIAASYMFQDCYSLTSVDLSGLDTSNVEDMSYMFQNCYSLTSVDLSGLFTMASSNTYFLRGASALQYLTIGAFTNSFDISQSTLYSADTLAAILEALATVSSTRTITMGSTNKAKLTDEQIAVATDKGWTVA